MYIPYHLFVPYSIPGDERRGERWTRITKRAHEPNGMKLGKAKKRGYRKFRYLHVNNFPILTLFRA